MASQDDNLIIRIQRDWTGWRTADVRLEDLEHVHWFRPAKAPQPLIHGYVRCDKVLAAEIPHDCDAARPHPVLVCVLKSHVAPAVYARLAERADRAARTAVANAGSAVNELSL